MLVLEGVRHAYGRREVLHGVSLHAAPGIYGLLGNNGAGKSTLIKLAATVLPLQRGRVSFDGNSRPRHDRRIRSQLGYLPQEYGLPGHLSCREYLAYVSAMKELDPRDPRSEPLQALARFGLEEAANTRIAALSGGMRQRLGLAQAFLGMPRLLILDEPSAGLDPSERVRLRGVIRDAAGEATVLLSTHIVSDVERSAATLGILEGGTLVAEGTPDQLVESASGFVYEVKLAPAEWDRRSSEWMRRAPDIGRWPGVVSSVSTDDGLVTVRVVTRGDAKGNPEATPVEPTLEDAYHLATSTRLSPESRSA